MPFPLAAFEKQNTPASSPAAGVVITPHAGEMAKLWGVERSVIVRDPLLIARQAVRKLGVVVALKGPHTYVAAPDGTSFHNTAATLASEPRARETRCRAS